MSEFELMLHDALEAAVPLRLDRLPDWDDVLARAGHGIRRGERLARRPFRLAFAFAAIFLLLAGVATAAYFVSRTKQPPAAVTALDMSAKVRTVWRCPTSGDCGAFVTDSALSRDGRRLAFVTDSVNSLSLYQGGLHVIDLVAGTDRQLPAAQPGGAVATAAQFRAWRRYYRTAARLLGCSAPQELAWSPDGSLLAYVCTIVRRGHLIGRIYTIRPDGTGRRLLRTDASAYWPTWSPDGEWIAFSTEPAPIVHTSRTGDDKPRRWLRSAIYVVDLGGSHRRLVKQGAAAPAWSPDGRTIAYWALGCAYPRNETGRTRLVTPEGRDVTPRSDGQCDGIGPADHPIAAWSPDGGRLAIRTSMRLNVMDAAGQHVTAIPGTDGFGSSRPLWQPGERR